MRIKDKILGMLSSIPFGLKGADKEIFGASEVNADGTSISQEVNDNRVAKHLLKGEVTQEVEELRYRTYKVASESENFTYLGNGSALKNEKQNRDNDKKRHFKQDNGLICQTVLETLNEVGVKGGVDKYRLEIGYKDTPRFKLEKYSYCVNVDIDEDKCEVKTELLFSSTPNPFVLGSKEFINELVKLMDVKIDDEYAINRSEIASNVSDLSFITYKASNEDEYVTYSFFGECKFGGIKQYNDTYGVTYLWGEYARVPLNLEEKYYSKSMDEKYKNHEKKDAQVQLVNVERKRYCSICGKEINTIDGDILESSGKEVICKECMGKTLKNENDSL